jgi:imidazolonepropionase-like amidohydrolase
MDTGFFQRTARNRQFMNNLLLLGISFTLLSIHSSAVAQKARRESRPVVNVETGKIRFYETKQLQGEETYEIRRTSNGSLEATAKIDLPFMGEEGAKPSLRATLQTGEDLRPNSFQIQGTRPLGVPINTSISVRSDSATISRATSDAPPGTPTLSAREVTVPKTFFTFGGYLPVTMEMMLVRYWLAHGRPSKLALLPEGEALVEDRGRDTVTIGGRRIALHRYHLSGSNWGGGWGRQTLWFDSNNRLVAAVNLASDLETNLTGIRDGYDSALSFFLKRAVEDGIDRLTTIADQLSPKTNQPLVLLGGTIIDVTGKPPIENSAVVIQGDRIIAAGPRSQLKIPNRATTIDATGKFLVPGLWDMHAHLYQVEFGPAYLAAGITTTRDVGNEIEYGTTMRDAAKQGRGLGPRMLLAGYIDGKNEGRSFDVQVDTPAEARAAVQRYKNAGFEQIKIRDHVKPDILKVITAEAHRLGMTVTGHVPESMNAIEAVEAGMDQINHLNFVAPALEPKAEGSKGNLSNELDSPRAKQSLKFFKDRGTVIDPTIATLELMLRPKSTPIESFEPGVTKVAGELLEQINQKGSPPEAAEEMRIALEYLLNIIGALHREGIPIIAGTDVSVPAYSLHRELELYVKAGLTPLEAIQAATITPARVMKLDNQVGTIEAGKRVDILILAANPLANISNIRKAKFVVAQGRLFDCSKLRESVGFKP